MPVLPVTCVLLTTILVSVVISRSSLVFALLALSGIILCCTSGFLASFEPGVDYLFRVVYAVGAIGALTAGCRLLRRKQPSVTSAS